MNASSRAKKHKDNAKQKRIALSLAKQRIFTVVTILLPVFILLMIECILRIVSYGESAPLFVSAPDETSQYWGMNRDVSRRYFRDDSFFPTPRKDLFLKTKTEDVYRIFVLGGSTTAGFPYGHNLSFPRILQRRLADTFSDRRIEVVNTAMTAINSYTILDFMDEIMACQPDAILIYAGHNEFYGALGVGSTVSAGKNRTIVLAYLKARHLRLFQLLQNGYDSFRHQLKKYAPELPAQDAMETQMARMAVKKAITLDDDLFKKGCLQFEENLNAICQKAHAHEIPVVLSELVSNLKDQAPFVSIAKENGNSAQSLFQKAEKLEKAGSFAEAGEIYEKAKDADALRFRAPEAFNDIIHRVADTFGYPVVPMKTCFETASPNGLIGNSLIYEHLHPNESGYFVMADAFYQTLRVNQWIYSEWPENTASDYPRNWGFTSVDSVYAALTILHLKGGFPFKKGPNHALDLFVPQTKIDSLCLGALKTGNATLEQIHMAMAQFYQDNGNLEQAFEEYQALIYTVPYLDLFYEPALRFLIQHGKNAEALSLAKDGLKLNPSGFMYKWAGQLSLVARQTQQGITYLEKARDTLPEDNVLLYNLARAYYATSQLNRGDAVTEELRQLSSDQTMVRMLESYRQKGDK